MAQAAAVASPKAGDEGGGVMAIVVAVTLAAVAAVAVLRAVLLATEAAAKPKDSAPKVHSLPAAPVGQVLLGARVSAAAASAGGGEDSAMLAMLDAPGWCMW